MAIELILVLAVLILVFSMALYRRWHPIAPREPSCGHCGYCVRGLPGLVCPECGSDLREVGILTKDFTRKSPNLSRPVLWTLALPGLALLISLLLLGTVLPYSQTLKIQRMIFCQAPSWRNV